MKVWQGMTLNFRFIIFISIMLALTDGVDSHEAFHHRHLELKTRLSQSVFLDPILSANKNIFIVVKNLSDRPIEVTKQLKSAFDAHGYHVVSNPMNARYFLQANILNVVEIDNAPNLKPLLQDVNYTMTTDVQISERVKAPENQYRRYRTRIVSDADKVNLSFQTARQALEVALVKGLVAIF